MKVTISQASSAFRRLRDALHSASAPDADTRARVLGSSVQHRTVVTPREVGPWWSPQLLERFILRVANHLGMSPTATDDHLHALGWEPKPGEKVYARCTHDDGSARWRVVKVVARLEGDWWRLQIGDEFGSGHRDALRPL